MYMRHFGLSSDPFSIAPDPRFLFLSSAHREALAHLLFGLQGGGGFVLLTGDVGAGKTTVCRAFLEQVPANCQVAYVLNPRLNVHELLQTVCEEFAIVAAVPGAPLAPGLRAAADAPAASGETATALTASPVALSPPHARNSGGLKATIDALNQHLLRRHADGAQCVLVIDEAQNLSRDVLEQLRLLTNLETNERKLLQIILIGQPELRRKLASPRLTQLAQRVIARYHLGPLSREDSMLYVQHRLAVAGHHGALPFSAAALRSLYRIAGGVPRRLNLLAGRALLGAYTQGQAQVGWATVRQAAREVFDDTAGQPDRPWLRLWPWQNAAGATAARAPWVAAAAGLLAAASWVGYAWMVPSGSSPARAEATAATAAAAAAAATSTARPAPPPVLAAAAAPTRTAASDASPSTGSAGSRDKEAGALAVAGADGEPGLARARAQGAAQGPAPATALGLTQGAAAAFGAAVTNEAAGWTALAQLWGETMAAPCATPGAGGGSGGLRCFRAGNFTLAQIRQLDRPGLVSLRGEAGTDTALLLALDGSGVRLLRGKRIDTLSTAQFGALWVGDFNTLWRARGEPQARATAEWMAQQLQGLAPPAGTATAATGATAAAAAAQATPAAAAEQVRAFQRAQGLNADGVPGAMTLMQLNRALGVAEPRLQR